MAASVQFSSMDNKAILEKYKKHFTTLEEDVTQEEDVITTIGYLINAHGVPSTGLNMYDQHHWSGRSDPELYNPIPPSILWGVQVIPPFRHQGPLSKGGSIAGVVYTDGVDSSARKWLVAFDRVNLRVYVEPGPIGPINWNKIKENLDRSGRTSEYEDPILGGRAYAEFSEQNRMIALFSTTE